MGLFSYLKISILFNNRYRGSSYQISNYGFRDFHGRIASFLSFPCNRNREVSLFSRLVCKLRETYKRNRKLEDKIHVLKMYLDVKENGGKFPVIFLDSYLSFITNEALAMVDVRPLSHFGDKRR